MNPQTREEALLETIRQGLFLSAVQDNSLGDRSKYLGVSEIAKYAECPRAAIASKVGNPTANMQRLLAMQRGHWFESGIKDIFSKAGLKNFHQLEINAGKKNGSIKAHLDFTLVWERPVKAVRILEIKSTDRLPEKPWPAHAIQTQAQIDLLRQCWNKPVFTLRNEQGEVLHEHMSFPAICKERFDVELSKRPASISVESWILYLSMKDAKAFGPYVYSSESLQMLKELAAAFKADLDKIGENPDYFDSVEFPKEFYPLCGCCEHNCTCPKFKAGSYQPEWEPAIQRLDKLKQRQNDIHAEITAIEDSLKQAHRLSDSSDWIETGGHRFRMSMVSGRKSLNQDALKMEIADILHGLGSEINVDDLFASCMKQSASFPRLTISTVN